MKLIKNMFYNASYQILAIILPLITVPYVTRVLSSTGVGINAYTFSIVTYFNLIAALGILIYGNREIAFVQNNKYKRSKVFWELVFLKFISSSLALALFLGFIVTQKNWQFYFLLQSINILATMFDISWYFIGREDFKKIVVRNTAIKLAVAILTFTIVKDESDLGLYIFLLAFSLLAGNLTVWPFLKKEIVWIPLRKLHIWKHLVPSLHLLLPQMMMQLYLSLNKSLLGMMDGVVSSGFFDQSDKIVRVCFTLVTALGGVFLPRLSNLFSRNKQEEARQLVIKLIHISNAISYLLVAGIIGVSSTFAVFFLGKGFEPVGPILAVHSLIILMISYGNALGAQYLLASARTKDYSYSALAGLVTNIILNLILIPKFGTMGAVVTSVATEFAVSAYQAYSLRRIFSWQDLFSGLWKYIISALLVVLTLTYLNQVLPVTIVNYLLQAIVGFVIYSVSLVVLKAPIVTIVKSFRK